jgi:hypothetical protein
VSEPVVIVTNDTHVGPRLIEDLRCPSRDIDDFERFAAMTAEQRQAAEQLLGGSGYLDHPSLRASGTTTRARAWPTTTTTASPPVSCSTVR